MKVIVQSPFALFQKDPIMRSYEKDIDMDRFRVTPRYKPIWPGRPWVQAEDPVYRLLEGA